MVKRETLARFKACRYLAYALVIVLWVPTVAIDIYEAARREWAASWADLSLTIARAERGWAQRKKQ